MATWTTFSVSHGSPNNTISRLLSDAIKQLRATCFAVERRLLCGWNLITNNKEMVCTESFSRLPAREVGVPAAKPGRGSGRRLYVDRSRCTPHILTDSMRSRGGRSISRYRDRREVELFIGCIIRSTVSLHSVLVGKMAYTGRRNGPDEL